VDGFAADLVIRPGTGGTDTVELLRKHHLRQLLRYPTRGSRRCAQASWVFTGDDGTALDPASRLAPRHPARREAGLRLIVLHHRRHTSASLGLASGESLLERPAGPLLITITADGYSYASVKVRKASAQRLGDHLGQG
jgi:integrase